jgi:hypothetical protein
MIAAPADMSSAQYANAAVGREWSPACQGSQPQRQRPNGVRATCCRVGARGEERNQHGQLAQAFDQ